MRKGADAVERHEMAEKLVEKCGITFEEAAEILKQTNYDMLEAMIILERQGRLNNGRNRYSTGGFVFEDKNQRKKTAADAESLEEFIRMSFAKLGNSLKNAMSYHLVISRPGEKAFSLPLIIAAVICLIFIYAAAAAAIIFMALGFNFSIEKKNGA